jgi:hypothetical protein
MRRGATVLIGILLVLAAGAAVYWIAGRGPQSAAAGPEGAPLNPRATDSPAAPSASKAGENSEPGAEAASSGGEKPAVAVGPLRPGEVFEYSANVAKLSNVASLRLETTKRMTFLGKNAWHFEASAHTQNPLRMMFALDDQFDSYSDAGNFTSLQYEMHLNERGQQVTSVQRMTTAGREPSEGVSQTRVLPGTRDPLGLMQYLRTIEWTKTPEVRCPVYDGHKLYEVLATLSGNDEISVPAGNYRASKIAIRVFDNGAELKDASFSLFLAQDSARTPVLLEAVMPFANARVELTKVH